MLRPKNTKQIFDFLQLNNGKSNSKCKSKSLFKFFDPTTEANSQNLKLKLICVILKRFEIGLQF